MTDPFSTVATELPRDKWGRPLISPPDGSDPVAYQRVTTFVGALEDTYHLSVWQQTMVALGMARRRDLQLAAAAITDPKDRFQKRTLKQIAKDAIEAAHGSAAANTGTALHTLTEHIDRDIPLLHVPEEFEPDLAAYRQVTQGFDFPLIEGFVVVDDLQVGGSFDRIFNVPGTTLTAPDGEQVTAGIWDLKTGGSTGGGLFGIGKIAMQMGTYRNGVLYDHTLGSRTPLPETLSRKWGIICHLPAGSGQAELLWVDIAAGWEAARDIAPRVHAWRKRKDLSHSLRTASSVSRELTIPALIAAATTREELVALHKGNKAVWTQGLTNAVKDRLVALGLAS